MVHKNPWQRMTFTALERGSQAGAAHAPQLLSLGGVVLEPLHAVPWSRCCATVTARYGVCWWLAI